MPSETITPNIGLQVPAFGQANWQVPTNFNWNTLDLIFGGEITVPALNVGVLMAGNIAGLLALSFVSESPAGAVPGTTYTCSKTVGFLLAVFINGVFNRLPLTRLPVKS
jgi:hypothetical protein